MSCFRLALLAWSNLCLLWTWLRLHHKNDFCVWTLLVCHLFNAPYLFCGDKSGSRPVCMKWGLVDLKLLICDRCARALIRTKNSWYFCPYDVVFVGMTEYYWLAQFTDIRVRTLIELVLQVNHFGPLDMRTTLFRATVTEGVYFKWEFLCDTLSSGTPKLKCAKLLQPSMHIFLHSRWNIESDIFHFTANVDSWSALIARSRHIRVRARPSAAVVIR